MESVPYPLPPVLPQTFKCRANLTGSVFYTKIGARSNTKLGDRKQRLVRNFQIVLRFGDKSLKERDPRRYFDPANVPSGAAAAAYVCWLLERVCAMMVV